MRDGKIETLEAEIRRLNEEAMKTFELTKSQASPLAHKERWGGLSAHLVASRCVCRLSSATASSLPMRALRCETGAWQYLAPCRRGNFDP